LIYFFDVVSRRFSLRRILMQPQSRPASITAELWQLVLAADTAVVSDVLNGIGVRNKALRAGIVPIAPGLRIAGTARTMKSAPCSTAATPDKEYELLFEAIDGLAAGQVLITDTMDCCVWGELCCERAQLRSSNGAVIDGYHRDTRRVIASGFPVFSLGAHPSDMLYHREIIAIDEPVVCRGVEVVPSDLIIADEDGVVVVPGGKIEEVMRACVHKAGLETQVREALRAGSSAAQAFEKFGVF
jgi:regulator of RNase E activity RraA